MHLRRNLPSMMFRQSPTHALAGAGSAAFAGAASFVATPVVGAVLGGCAFALASGKGEGVYAGVARLRRRLVAA